MHYIKYGSTLTAHDLADGVERAAAVLHTQAEKMREELGFGFVAQPDAPDTFEELSAAWTHSTETQEPLPVPSTNLDDCFYLPHTVHALRFVHDAKHMLTGLTFDMHDELRLAIRQMNGFVIDGLSPWSLEYGLLHADFVGQAQCMLVTRQFVSDQSAFIVDAVQFGIDEAILREMNRGGYKTAA